MVSEPRSRKDFLSFQFKKKCLFDFGSVQFLCVLFDSFVWVCLFFFLKSVLVIATNIL